jgi:serine/threonine-protein kinase
VKTCPVCGKEYADDVKFCPLDGSTLRAKSPTADLVGQVVADRYHIIKKLGEGGMGAVYLGEHVKMGRKSAIKVMNPSMAADPDAISRFNREAANASRISHPNVCQIYDFGETPDGTIYLAMEFVEGVPLTVIIEREGALPAARAAKILRQAADALASAHELGIVHRDLKPDNIMIVQGKDGGDIVKVVDFGIAKAVAGDETGQKVTKTGLVVGTPEYMSPEQLSGDKLDGRSDIYSLGLVFYRMLTGVLPFQADSAQETMIKRLTDEPMRLAAARPDITFPPELQVVLDKALTRLPADRYTNAAQFGRDAEAAVVGLPRTRVAEPPHSAATQLMDAEAGLQAKRAPGRPAPTVTRRAAAAKRFPLVPVLGGVGGVGVIAVVAVLAMSKLSGKTQLGAVDTLASRDTTQAAAGSPDTAKRGGSRTTDRNPRPTSQGQATGRPGPSGGPAPTSGPAVSLADSLQGGVGLIDRGDSTAARRMLLFVWNSADATRPQKGEAAFNIAATYGDDRDNVVRWLRRSADMGFSAASDALRSLGANP